MLKLNNIIFKASNGSKSKTILKDISLDIPDNKFIVITGPNGSGKSTLAKIITGIIRPTSGQIILDDDDITKKSITDRAKLGLSYSFQQPVKIKGVTVRDLLEVASLSQDVNKYLIQVGLEPSEYLDRELSGTLSGGELKRIEIASCLARNTKYLIFDEPEAGIDLWSFSDLTGIFKKIRKNHTIIIISHQERIIRLADEVIVCKTAESKSVLVQKSF